MTNINCIFYMRQSCIHRAAPSKLFGACHCILEYPIKDIRYQKSCTLQVPHFKPDLPPKAP